LIAFTLSALPCQFSTIESLPQAPIVQLTMRSFIGNQQNTRDAEGTPALAQASDVIEEVKASGLVRRVLGEMSLQGRDSGARDDRYFRRSQETRQTSALRSIRAAGRRSFVRITDVRITERAWHREGDLEGRFVEQPRRWLYVPPSLP
jgi:hypothetical protein